jgi:cell division protein FtsI (penicillin-binding protein 3)
MTDISGRIPGATGRTRAPSTRSATRPGDARVARRVGIRPQADAPLGTALLRRRLARGPVRHGSPRRRLITVWLVAVLATGALVLRLVALQVSPSERLVEAGEEQRLRTIDIDAPRGAIVDRNGAELAISVPATTFYADSRAVTDAAGDAAKLAPILGEDPIKVQEKLVSGRSFVYLARQVDDDTAAAIEQLGLTYVGSYREDKRVLPAGSALASSVVGRTDPDLTGISGVEKEYDDVLRGKPGELVVERGAGGRSIPGAEEQLDPATPGSNLVLSLDRGLQYEVEQMLLRAVDEAGAKGGTVLVAKPNGEVLVDANVVRRPLTPDPATTGATTTTAATNGADDSDAAPVVYGPATTTSDNRAITWTYEPGSVNKVITMAGVLEEGMATPDDARPVASSLDYIGKRFVQETRSTEEVLSLRDILAKSDNLGTISWATDLGRERLESYLRRFGLGAKTAIGWEYESAGKLPDYWSATTLPTVSIGQSLAVTPMQMLEVYNTIANDGVRAPAQLVLGTETPEGTFVPQPTEGAQRVVSEATAAALRDMLRSVVTDGTGTRAQVPGFTVAGKTGTAWKPLPEGGYDKPGGGHALVTSFIGFLPADHPELTILVVLDEPANQSATGGTLAAPLFRDVATYAVSHLRIPPDAGAATVDPATERVRAEPQAVVVPTTTAAPITTTKQG